MTVGIGYPLDVQTMSTDIPGLVTTMSEATLVDAGSESVVGYESLLWTSVKLFHSSFQQSQKCGVIHCSYVGMPAHTCLHTAHTMLTCCIKCYIKIDGSTS